MRQLIWNGSKISKGSESKYLTTTDHILVGIKRILDQLKLHYSDSITAGSNVFQIKIVLIPNFV